MAFTFRVNENVETGIRRIARQELRGGIANLRDQQPDLHEAVHVFRKRCKKLRGLIRLVRPHLGDSYADYNSLFRDLARDLSSLRDTQAKLEALDRLCPETGSSDSAGEIQRIRDYLLSSQQQALSEAPLTEDRLAPLMKTLKQVARRVKDWTLPAPGFDAIKPGLKATYRKARRAMASAYANPGDHSFHDWRKSVKYHWHHTTLLRPMQTALLDPHHRLADDLGELLGQDHDYAVLREQLLPLEYDVEFQRQRDIVLKAIDTEQDRLRTAMRPIGACLFAESPGRFVDRWQVYWEAWQNP